MSIYLKVGHEKIHIMCTKKLSSENNNSLLQIASIFKLLKVPVCLPEALALPIVQIMC